MLVIVPVQLDHAQRQQARRRRGSGGTIRRRCHHGRRRRPSTPASGTAVHGHGERGLARVRRRCDAHACRAHVRRGRVALRKAVQAPTEQRGGARRAVRSPADAPTAHGVQSAGRRREVPADAVLVRVLLGCQA